MKDFYYILGTRTNATHGEIVEAYQKLAQKFKSTGGERDYFMENHFREITEAYEILIDPVKRRRHDEALQKHQRKQLAYFRTRPVNIVFTLLLVALTSVMGYYVYGVLTTHKNKSVAVATREEPVVIPHITRHHHKKHSRRSSYFAMKKQPVKYDTVSAKPIAAKAAEPKITTPVKQAPVVAAAVVHEQPVIIKRPTPKPDSSFVAYLKDNINGDVYIHETADYMSPVVVVLPRRSKVRVLQNGTTFCKINFNDNIGYIPKWTLAAR